jgi:hypothetical protein
MTRDELIRRANAAVRVAKAGERGARARAPKGTPSKATAADPTQMLSLAHAAVSLVLTTNYDNFSRCLSHALALSETPSSDAAPKIASVSSTRRRWLDRRLFSASTLLTRRIS